MHEKKIDNKLRNLIGNNRIKPAIIAMKCLVIDYEFSKTILSISSRFESAKQKEIRGVSRESEIEVANNKLVADLLKLIEDLPKDNTLIQRRLMYEVEFDLPNALKIASKILATPKDQIVLLINRYQNNQITFENTTDNNYGEIYLQINESIKQDFINIVDQLYIYFLEDNFHNIFWAEALQDKEFHYTPFSNMVLSQGQNYYNDIIDYKNINDKAKAYLLRWEEEYLAGDKAKAEDYIDKVRTELGIVGSMINEYKSLSYLAFTTPKKIINNAIYKKNMRKSTDLNFT